MKIDGYSKDFIRETWDRIKWIEIFQHWYLRDFNNHLICFADFMLTIDPKREFWKPS